METKIDNSSFEYLDEKDITWERTKSKDLSDSLITNMHHLYILSYKVDLRFSNFNSFKENVLKNCTYLCYKNKPNKELIGYFLLVITNFGIKLTMSCNNQTPFAKQILYNKLAQLLVTPGYYQESSGAVSWILRSRYHLYPITDITKIKAILKDKLKEVKEYGDGGIKINNDWNFLDRDQHVYFRYVRSRKLHRIEGKDVNVKSISESLFGMPCAMGPKESKKLFRSFINYQLISGQCNEIECKMIQSVSLSKLEGGSEAKPPTSMSSIWGSNYKHRKYKSKYLKLKKLYE